MSCLAYVLMLDARRPEAEELLRQARAVSMEKGGLILVERVGELEAELAQLSVDRV
jgi:hypothetical protein